MRDRALSEKGNGALETIAEQEAARTSDRVMPLRESLHSIAVELNRANQLTAQSLRLQERQCDLFANVLDIQRASMVAVGSNNNQGLEKILALAETLLGVAMAKPASTPSATTRIGPSPDTVTSEKGGTRVEQAPGS